MQTFFKWTKQHSFILVLNSKKIVKKFFFGGKPNYTCKENVHHLFPQNTSQNYAILEREISTIHWYQNTCTRNGLGARDINL